ncbi:MAG: PQQ-binding-like beta-propeller repeat protein [Planctomycetes bacterium]|nr:PQQ-binding-like beta-propeller repeat protein [Planctomycetota bacterium]
MPTTHLLITQPTPIRAWHALIPLLGLACAVGPLRAAEPVRDWPQAGGPDGSWSLAVADAPLRWSVALDQHLAWRTPLPNGGQGNIAVAAGRIYLTTFAPFDGKKQSNAILGHAIDQQTGRILWSVPLQAGRNSPLLYAFSDSTSWTPICDAAHVWFFNSSGEMGCWTVDGKEVWRRQIRTQPDHFPFNRQCEPMLVGNDLITVEPLAKDDAGYRADRDEWNYLRGVDKLTGKTRWIAEDGTTFYCTPVAGRLPDGRPAVLHGRGGPHGVPETPIGLTMTSLAPGEEGKTIWRFSPAAEPGGPLDGTTWMAQYNATWDQQHAYWFKNAPEESQIVLDVMTGVLVATQSLVRNVDVRQWDEATHAYHATLHASLRDVPDVPAYALKPGEVLHVLPEWHSNIVTHGHTWFLCTTNNRRNGHAPNGHSGPSHSVGRIDNATGAVAYLELPVGVERKPGQEERRIYGRSLKTRAEDSQGHDIADEDRSRTDGWEVDAFFSSPVALGDHVYFSTLLGVTYVLDANAKVLDEHALTAVNDLGALGETWSLSGPAYSNGMLYHRSSKELVAITGKRGASGTTRSRGVSASSGASFATRAEATKRIAHGVSAACTRSLYPPPHGCAAAPTVRWRK